VLKSSPRKIWHLDVFLQMTSLISFLSAVISKYANIRVFSIIEQTGDIENTVFIDIS